MNANKKFVPKVGINNEDGHLKMDLAVSVLVVGDLWRTGQRSAEENVGWSLEKDCLFIRIRKKAR